MTIKEVAEFLRTQPQVINNWLYNGTLPRKELTLKIGAKVLFVKEKLINYLTDEKDVA